MVETVAIWIPGFYVEGTRLSRTSLETSDTNVYSLRCICNEMIDNFKVIVRAISPTEAEVTVMGVDGRTAAFCMSTDYDGLVDCIRSDSPPVAMEMVYFNFGDRSCWVHFITGDRACIAWICNGIVYRTIHDAGEYRLVFDIDTNTML